MSTSGRCSLILTELRRMPGSMRGVSRTFDRRLREKSVVAGCLPKRFAFRRGARNAHSRQQMRRL